MEQYERLERAANTVNALAAVLMVLMICGAVFVFFAYRVSLSTAIWLFIGGCIVGVMGEAVSRTMDALAQHMKDSYVTRKCMEKLVGRLERPKS